MKRRTILADLLAAAALASGPAHAAGDYPTKPVKILFGFPPASATDFIARTVGDKLSQKWGQGVVIDNRPGAGGNLASAIAAKEPNDGYTIFFGTVANAISTSYYSKLNYDYLKDFTPVTLVATTPLVLVVTKKQLARDGSAAVFFDPQSAATTPTIRFAVDKPYRPWHEQRRFSREARGMPPYKQPEKYKPKPAQ